MCAVGVAVDTVSMMGSGLPSGPFSDVALQI